MKKILIATLILAASTAMANEGYYVGLDVGASRDMISTSGASGSHYAFDKRATKLPLLGINAGYNFSEAFSAGLNFTYLPARNGDFTDVGLTVSSYKTQTYVLLATGKFNLDTGTAFSPFVKAGLGFANNRVNYSSPAVSGVDPQVAINDKVNKNTFAYGIDLGVDYKIADNSILGLSLGYLNTGSVTLPKFKEKTKFSYYTLKFTYTYNF